MKRTMWAVLLVLCTAGCLPVLVGTLVVKSSKSKGQKQEFMSRLQTNNADRESKGLAPLEWCGEAYRFDKGWAMEDPGCATRIKSYEAGDLHALDAGGATPTVTAAASEK